MQSLMISFPYHACSNLFLSEKGTDFSEMDSFSPRGVFPVSYFKQQSGKSHTFNENDVVTCFTFLFVNDVTSKL